MRPIVQLLDGVWTDLLGWAAVLTGLAAVVLLVVLHDRIRRARQRRAGVAVSPARLEPCREWEMVMRLAARELARAPEVAAIQADAACKIDAAELAYNRLVADCARFCGLPVTPTFEPGRQLARPPEPQERQPLAA